MPGISGGQEKHLLVLDARLRGYDGALSSRPQWRDPFSGHPKLDLGSGHTKQRASHALLSRPSVIPAPERLSINAPTGGK